MEQNDHHHHHHNNDQLHHQPRPSRLGLTNTVGEIVEVNGGHIVRSTGRKDRHSKVCTAKGTRDRRVRLSAHTAIQFYDVQDRLGYDRPSKAVDWLINKAKASIDELAELPPWKPTAGYQNPSQENVNHRRLSDLEEHPDDDFVDIQMGSNQNSGLLPTSLDSIKSFFPAGNNNNNNSSGMQFHHSFPQSELITRPGNPNQDLKLSLQSFQDPISHHQSVQGSNNNNNMYFDGGSSWPENSGFSGFVFSSPATQTTPFMQPLYGHPTNSQLLSYISQRGPLQSSNTPPVRAWVDPPIDQHPTLAYYPGFSSGLGGFPGQHFPARTGGEEEEHDGVSDKPSSASSDSHH